jgi:hypothetical protein
MELIKRAGIAVLGTIATLGWWTIRGPGDDHGETVKEVPKVVWEGGTPVTIDATCSHEGKLHLSFNRSRPEDEEGPDQSLEVNVTLPAGEHSYTIEVPAKVHGYVELGVDKPPVGAKASVQVHAGGKLAAENKEELTAPLQEGYAFFAQVFMNDYAAGEVGDD